jgi:hypothetical protein
MPTDPIAFIVTGLITTIKGLRVHWHRLYLHFYPCHCKY